MKNFWREVWAQVSMFAPLIGMLVAIGIIMGLFKLLGMIGGN